MMQAFTLHYLQLEFLLLLFLELLLSLARQMLVHRPKSLLVRIFLLSHELNTAVEVKILIKVEGHLVGFFEVPFDNRLSREGVQVVPNDLNSSLLGHG